MSSRPEYLAEFAHLRDAAVQVGALINEIDQSFDAPSNIELEGRLGRLTASGFDPDVGSSVFCLLLQMLEAFPRWSHVDPWQDTQDIFYNADLPGYVIGETDQSLRPLLVRTTVKASSDETISLSHIVKKKVGKVDLRLQSIDVGCCALETPTPGNHQKHIDARVALCFEFPVPQELLPVAVIPEFVRIKQRKRFYLGSLGVAKDCFSFDLSVVYKGHTRTEAEAKQLKGDEASFEVECECLAPKDYLLAANNDSICLGLSILLKLLDFASALNPSASVTFVPYFNNPSMMSSRKSYAPRVSTGLESAPKE